MPSNDLQLTLSWIQVYEACRSLANKIEASDYDSILAVSRGGLVPAAIISHLTGIRQVDSVQISSYEDGEHEQGQISLNLEHIPYVNKLHKGKRLLIIDDILDTGATKKLLEAYLPEATFGCVISKQKHPYRGIQVAKNCWVVFPWE